MNLLCIRRGVSQATQTELIQNQLYHLERMLQAMTAEEPTWLLAAGHYPIFSDSSSGNVTELITYLLPLLQKYHVHAYLCGHDHLSEHLTFQNMHFFVAGAGSMTDKISKKSAAMLQWAGPGYAAFAYMDATPETLTIRYVDIDNVEQYEFTLTDPHERTAVDSDPPAQQTDDGADTGDDTGPADGSDPPPGPVDGSDLDKLQERIEEEENKVTIAVAVAAASSGLLALSAILVLVYFYGGKTGVFWKKKNAAEEKSRKVDDGVDPKQPLELLETSLPTCSTCNAAKPTWTSPYTDEDDTDDSDGLNDADQDSDEAVWSHSYGTSTDGDPATAFTTNSAPPPPILPTLLHQRLSLPRPSHRYASYNNSPQSGLSPDGSGSQSRSSSQEDSHSGSYSSYSSYSSYLSERSLPPPRASVKGSSFLTFLSLPTFLRSATSSFSSLHDSPPTMPGTSSTRGSAQPSTASSQSSVAMPVRYPHHRRNYQQLSGSEYVRLDEQHTRTVSGPRVVTTQPPRPVPASTNTMAHQPIPSRLSDTIQRHFVRGPLAPSTEAAAVPVQHVHFAPLQSAPRRQPAIFPVPLVPIVEIRGDDATASTLTAASIQPISSVSDGSADSDELQRAVTPLFVPVHSPEHLAHLRRKHNQPCDDVKSAHRRVKSSSL